MAIASSRARSRPACGRIRRCARRSSCRMTGRVASNWWPTWCPSIRSTIRPQRSAVIWKTACRPTWCRRSASRWRACRSPATASWIAARCPSRYGRRRATSRRATTPRPCSRRFGRRCSALRKSASPTTSSSSAAIRSCPFRPSAARVVPDCASRPRICSCIRPCRRWPRSQRRCRRDKRRNAPPARCRCCRCSRNSSTRPSRIAITGISRCCCGPWNSSIPLRWTAPCKPSWPITTRCACPSPSRTASGSSTMPTPSRPICCGSNPSPIPPS
ncbi:hypothetical protein CURE108131_25500 [Cupriavidus respiraculi]